MIPSRRDGGIHRPFRTGEFVGHITNFPPSLRDSGKIKADKFWKRDRLK